MAQHDYAVDNASGAAVRADINNALAAIVSLNAGLAAPSPTFANQLWADTTNALLKKRDSANATWVTIGSLDAAGFGLVPLAGGTLTGQLREAKFADIAAGATVDLAAAAGNYGLVTGIADITSFGTVTAGAEFQVTVTSTPTLKYNAGNLITPTAADIICEAGDSFLLRSLGAGAWRVVVFQRASGAPLLGAGVAPGIIQMWPTHVAPAGYLLCDGAAVSRATYAALFAAICPVLGTITFTINNPCVATLNGHGLQTGDRLRFSTTSALPTGLTANTDYYVIKIDANTFWLATSLALAEVPTKITTSGSQSGVHTAQYFPHGAGNGTTTFTLPDGRGRSLIGVDAMGGGSAAGRVTYAGVGIEAKAIGTSGGEQMHTLTIAEMPSHDHQMQQYSSGTTGTGGIALANNRNPPPTNTGSTGGGGAHNNMQPTLVVNFIIKT